MNARSVSAGLHRLLEIRGWDQVDHFGPFVRFQAPNSCGLPEDFRLLLPEDPTASGAEDQMLRSIALIAEVHRVDQEDLFVALSENATVFSTRVRDDAASGGSLPLDRFESLVDRLRKVCLTAASSILTDDPLDEGDSPDAREFVSQCSFLQTRIGSFESRITIPNDFQLGRRLERPEGVPATAATNRIRTTLSTVFDDIVPQRQYIYEREFIDRLSGFVHIPLLRNVALLLRDAAFRSYEFRFVGADEQTTIEPQPVTRRDIDNVYGYVRFLRDKLASGISINVAGKVTELRSQDIKSSNNHVRVRGYDLSDRREMELALSLGRAGYIDAVTAHGRGQTVHVVGVARRLQSYYRVDDLQLFELA